MSSPILHHITAKYKYDYSYTEIPLYLSIISLLFKKEIKIFDQKKKGENKTHIY